jgi:hypothetical protein
MATYDNRVYDFLALQNVQSSGDAQLGLELFTPTNSGLITTGVQKLAQRWLLEFLTESGSMPGLPTRGTNFMTLVKQGRLRTTAAITAQFHFAAHTARIALSQEENDSWTDDERIGEVKLQSLAFLPGYAKLYVSVSSRAGNTREIIMPIATLPKNLM